MCWWWYTHNNNLDIPQPKPWMNGDICSMLISRTAAFSISRMNPGNLVARTRQADTSSANPIWKQKDNTDSNLNWCLTTQTHDACGKDYRLSQTTKANPAVWCPPKPPSQRNLTYSMLASRQTILSHPGRQAAPDDLVLLLSEADVRNSQKNIPGHVFNVCWPVGGHLLGHFQPVPVPSCSPHLLQGDYHHPSAQEKQGDMPKWLALTSESGMAHIKASMPGTLDPLQCAYCSNRSTENVISITIHTALTHLNKRNTSQKFGHTYSFKGFSLFFYYFLHCRILLKISKLVK
jgi:hypothetical protein